MRNLILIAAAGLMLAAAPAEAYQPTRCLSTLRSTICWSTGVNRDAKVVNRIEERFQPREITDEAREAWQRRCQPVKKFDGYVDRWVYAEANCASGP